MRKLESTHPEHAMELQLTELARYIEAHADLPLPLRHLAARVGRSATQLQRAFKAAFGVSPKAYQDAIRTRRMKLALKRGERVTDAIHEAGYGSSSRAYRSAQALGMAPKRYARGGAGETISYASVMSALGPLLLAATDRGVCFVEFGDSIAALEQALAREFPLAYLVPAAESEALQAWLAALAAHLRQDGPAPQLPLDLRGTAFQIKVWRFLSSLAPGRRLSYRELAVAIGAPKAIRAAASACACNKIALLVPCHRVLRSNGTLGGYRWGLARKAALLQAELAEMAGASTATTGVDAAGRSAAVR